MHFRVSSVLENWLNEVFCYYFPSCISNIFLCGNTRTWNAHADSIILILPSVTQQCRGSAISTNSGQKFNFVNENRSYLFKWNPSLHDSLMTVENFFKFPEYSKMIFFLLILIKEFQSLSFKLITTFFLVSISFQPRSKSSLKHFSIYFEPLKKSILVLSSIIFYSKNWKSFFCANVLGEILFDSFDFTLKSTSENFFAGKRIVLEFETSPTRVWRCWRWWRRRRWWRWCS